MRDLKQIASAAIWRALREKPKPSPVIKIITGSTVGFFVGAAVDCSGRMMRVVALDKGGMEVVPL